MRADDEGSADDAYERLAQGKELAPGIAYLIAGQKRLATEERCYWGRLSVDSSPLQNTLDQVPSQQRILASPLAHAVET